MNRYKSTRFSPVPLFLGQLNPQAQRKTSEGRGQVPPPTWGNSQMVRGEHVFCVLSRFSRVRLCDPRDCNVVPVKAQEWLAPRPQTEQRRSRHKPPGPEVMQAEWGLMSGSPPPPAHLT